jgi:hypothetical protein
MACMHVIEDVLAGSTSPWTCFAAERGLNVLRVHFDVEENFDLNFDNSLKN